MAVIVLGATTPQVRPFGSGAWNNVTLSSGSSIAQKSTTFGVTLTNGGKFQALRGINQFFNGGQAGTMDRIAQKIVRAVGLEIRDMGALATGMTGTGATANVLDRGEQSGYAQIEIVTTVGATPTCTFQLEGSPDNSSWSVLSSADSGTPTTFSTATFAITSATTTLRIINPASTSARYLRVTLSANTNVTATINAAVN